MKRDSILRLLASPESGLLITRGEYLGALLRFIPLDVLGEDSPTYRDLVSEELQEYSASIKGITLSVDFGSDDLPSGSLAYHRIKGLITSDSSWYYFSSKQFEKDLLLSESNPNIHAHFVHITSGGGEAWYLDRLSETIAGLGKPFYVLIEKRCASAAYYIGCHGCKVKALTQNDLVG